MGMMDRIMEFMAARMSKKDKERVMDKMMDKFFGNMTLEEKRKMMVEMMPKMMEGINMRDIMPQMMMTMMGSDQSGGGMMSRMMGIMSGMRTGEQGGDIPNPSNMGRASPRVDSSPMSEMTGATQGNDTLMMPDMMTRMMPLCLEMMLPRLPKQNRMEFIQRMMTALLETGTVGMSDEERNECIGKIVEQVTTFGAVRSK